MNFKLRRITVFLICFAMLVGIIPVGAFNNSLLAIENPFADNISTYENQDFAFPGAPEKWTNSSYKRSSQAVHDTEIYYENGIYYAYLTNDTNVYSSFDMLNWTVTGTKPRGWYSDSEKMYVTWAPQLIKLKTPYELDGELFYYALWDSLSELGSQHSRIRCFVSKTPSPTEADGAGFRYIGDVMGSGRYAQSNPTGVLESFEGRYNGKDPQYYHVNNYTTSHSATNANGWNAIDSMVLYDQEGKMWMSWGSWFGGAYICEIDERTLMPKSNDVKDYIRVAYRPNGGMEGPTIIYHEGYYYLNVAYGNLNHQYNTRIGRSTNIQGPYLDYNGNPMTNNSTYTGTKIAAPYSFDNDAGWLAQAHAAYVYNNDTGEYFMTSNGRPVGNTGTARMMVRSVIWTESGWPLVSPQLVTGDTTKTVYEENIPTGSAKVSAYQTIPTHLIPGSYDTVFFTRGTDTQNATKSQRITLHDDYTVTGAYTGHWAQTGETVLKLMLEGIEYEAALTATFDWENHNSGVICFSAISEAGNYTDNSKGAAMWGKQVYIASPEVLVQNAIDSISIPSETRRDISLPTNYQGVVISWESDNEAVLSNAGVVSRQEEDVEIELTATFSYKGLVLTEKFYTTVLLIAGVPSLEIEPVVYMPFNDSLKVESATGVGVQSANGSYSYGEGKFGSAVSISHVSGSGGLNNAIRLSNGALNNPSEFTVSMWVKPTTLTAHTSTFFSRGNSKWTSLVPSLYGSNSTGVRICDDSASESVWHDAESGVALETNNWYMLTYTYKNSTIYYYVNGELKSTVPNAVNPMDAGSSQSFYIGANEWDGTFQGLMDDFYLFDSALDIEQIGLLMNKSNFEVYHKYGEETPILDEVQSIKGIVSGEPIASKQSELSGYVFSHISVDGIVFEEESPLDSKNPNFSGVMHSNDVSVVYHYISSLVVDMKFDANTLNSDGTSPLYTGSGSNLGTLTYETGIQGQAVRMPTASGNALSNVIRLQNGILGNSDKFTISMWIKPDALTQHTSVFFSRAGSSGANNKWMSVVPLLQETNTVGVRICDDSQGTWHDVQGSIALSTGKWSMLTYTFENDLAKLYVDGVIVGEISGASNPMSGGSSQTFYIGGNQWDGSFNGLIDTFQLYRTALDSQQVSDLFREQGLQAPSLTLDEVVAGIEDGTYPVEIQNDNDGYPSSVVLPSFSGFELTIVESSNEAVISKDGSIIPQTTDKQITITIKVSDADNQFKNATVMILIKAKTNKNNLKALLDEAKKYLPLLSDYTNESAEEFSLRYGDALEVYGNDASTQHEIEQVESDLQNAINHLIPLENYYHMAYAGNMVSVPIFVKDVLNVAAAEITVSYDPKLLTFVGITETPNFYVSYSASNGIIKLAIISLDGLGLDGDVILSYIKFMVKTDVGHLTRATITVESKLFSGNTEGLPQILPNKAENATVIIFTTLPGDVNFDGKIDLADALMILQYISKNREFNDEQIFAADCTLDGEITLKDVLKIMYSCVI